MNETAKMIALEQTASQYDWPQDRVDAAKKQINITEEGAEQLAHIEVHQGKVDEELKQNLGLRAAADTLQLQDSALHGDWSQDQIDRAMSARR